MSQTYAPVALFVYSRPWHTRRTLESLANNRLARNTDLFVFSDGAKDKSDEEQVAEVRRVVQQSSGFRNICVIQRDDNLGLARNIVDGVSYLCERYGRSIVVEDDLVTGSGFLAFMNQALDHYADQKAVWHVSGWNYPIDSDGLDDAFFWKTMNCWGWATWQDRWQYFKKDPQYLLATHGKKWIRAFNIDDAYDFWGQVEANSRGEIDTWAVFWYATIFEHGGYCLNATKALVENIGHDGSGENCSESNCFERQVSELDKFVLPDQVDENQLAVERIKRFLRQNSRALFSRVIKRLKWW